MTNNRLLVILVTLAALTLTAAAQAPNSQSNGSQLGRTRQVLQTEIRKLLRETGIPSIPLAAVKGGQRANQALGRQSRDCDRGRPGNW